MTGWLSAPYVRDLVSGAYDHEFTVSATPQWTHAVRAVRLPDHGWKLHVSCRAADLPDLAAVLVPYLLAGRHPFKLAAGVDVLAVMNQGWEMPATVGKAFTIYPAPEHVRKLGLALAGLLRGRVGPRILSDRRVAPDAPVYYRYGPFVAQWFRGERGMMSVQIPGPDGARFDAAAELHYRQPEWVTDPFGHEAAEPELLAGRYRVERGILRAAHGDVFRGTDTATGAPVVIKQARSFVGDSGDGTDSRTRLRNERRVLAALGDVDGVPRFLDHFAHGADEYLVSTDLGDENLQARALIRGGLPVGTLGRDLARIIRALHDRDVIMRDLTPRNVVLSGDRAGLVDFGISALHGLHPRGGTMGFAPSRQMRGAAARPEDDAHALGMTLSFAATGLLPVQGETTDGLAAARMRSSLTALFGASAPLLHDLISGDAPRALAALHSLADGAPLEPIKSRRGYAESPLPPAAVRPGGMSYVEARTQTIRPLTREQHIAERMSRVEITAQENEPLLHRRHMPAQAPQLAESAEAPTHEQHMAELMRHPSEPPGHTPHLTGARGRTPDVAELRRKVLRIVLDETAARVLRAPGFASFDGTLYTGSAGLGLELLHHREAHGVPPLLDDLLKHAIAGDRRAPRPPGLFLGSTGTLLFRVRMGDPDAAGPERAFDTEDEHDDVITGIAGCGIGHLLLDDVPAARACVDALLAADTVRMSVTGEQTPSTDPASSYAHGTAGVLDLLLRYASRTGDQGIRDEAAKRAGVLADTTANLIVRARGREAVPLAVSWCQGLSGIGGTMLRAADVLGDNRFAALALEAAEVCASWIPRMQNPSQCCGLAGVGTYLVDCARHTGEASCLDDAHEVARQLIRRSHGADDDPRFIDLDRQDAPLSWSSGYTGILTFLRRLDDPASPDLPS
ncbi:lanthionine synthetase LanC family protein [Catenuloplanes sp. NPDC051500]|uniref:class III lanthionine synthetase LanKC N-terminal domain-containing protein n=1 Tax=Catenuloplanes sp. NPDC051500 TaxID=3363959 RepID=UPI00378F17DF